MAVPGRGVAGSADNLCKAQEPPKPNDGKQIWRNSSSHVCIAAWVDVMRRAPVDAILALHHAQLFRGNYCGRGLGPNVTLT